MNGAKQAVWLFILVCVLAVTGWFFARGQQQQHLSAQALALTPDIRVTKLSVRQFDLKGRLVNHLISPGLDHIPQEDKYIVRLPDVKVEHEQNDIWMIRAKRAILLQGGETIRFEEDVRITQKKEALGQDISLIKTSSLSYYPKLKKAYTDQHVSFEQMGTEIESLGMEAWLDKKMVKLLKQARGHYVPSVA